MKRLLALLIALGALAAPARLAAQAIPVGPGGELSSLVGLPIEVPLVVDLSGRPERLGSFSVRLQWDPAVLRLEMGRYGSFGEVAGNDDSVAFGIIRLAGVNPVGAVGLITLGSMRLTPLANATTTLHVTLDELFAAGTFADLKPFAVVSDGLYCPARGFWGDIDKDGNANSRDALIALSNAVGLDVSAFDVGLGDVDGSGTTNARDALIILSNAVGIDVSAFRVLRLAGGACAAGSTLTLAIAPSGVELVSGQDLLFEARASDSTGALQTLTDLTWKSSNPAVLGVFADGRAVARDAGTAVVTVLRGTRDSAQTTVTVVARRTTHWVDILARDARVRLGSAALPFGSIEDALEFAQDGDTVRARPGRYSSSELGNSLTLDRPVVLIGDTAADGSRPTLVGGGPWGEEDAVDLVGPGRRELHNFTLEGFSYGVWVYGPDRVLLRGVRMRDVYYGVSVGSSALNVRIERSQLLGIGLTESYASGVTAEAPIDTLTIEDTEIADFPGAGVSVAGYVDSLTIRRSLLHDFGSYAVTLGSYGDICSECSPPGGAARARPAPHRSASAPARAPHGAADFPMSQALVIERSRLERANYKLVEAAGSIRRVALAHNALSNPGNDVLYVYSSGNGGYLSMLGDSIVAPPDRQHYAWINAQYLDSLVIDSLQAVGFEWGYTYDVRLVRMTNSVLRDLRDYGLEVGFGGYTGSAGGVLQLDNVGLYGDPRDDLRGDGIEHYGARVEANHVTAVNLWEGIDAECSDSSTTITNSLFRHVAYPIYWCSNSYPAPDVSVLTVRNTTFRGFSTAIDSYDGRVVVDSNTFENGDLALDLGGPLPIAVTRNRITAVRGGMDLYPYDRSVTETIADNVLGDVSQWGIYASEDTYYYYADTLQTVFDVRRNSVTCSAAAASSGTGIELRDAHLVANDNVVAGCYKGIWTSVYRNTARRDSIVGNTVTVPPNAPVGILVVGEVEARVGRNIVTGATTGTQEAGLINVLGGCEYYGGQDACPTDDYIPAATIDSNTVTGGTSWGIRAEGVDTLTIVGNTVRNLNTATGAYGYSEDFGGIAVFGYLQRFARVVGNVVRSIRGNGIVAKHNGPMLQVDSNVVADVDSTGVWYGMYGGGLAITRNLVTGARRDGIRLVGYGAVTVTGNNIAGNAPFGLYLLRSGSVDAPDNWWGDPLGPRCFGGACAAAAAGVGDSVGGAYENVPTFTPVRLAPNDSVPLLPTGAPRFLAQAAPAPPARPAGNGDSLDAPIPRMDRYARTPRVQAQRPAPATGAATATGPAAERRAAQERERTAAAARRAERLQQLRARAEARQRVRQAASAPRRPAGQEVRP